MLYLAFIDYNKFNFCSLCNLQFPKEKGYRCINCGYKVRTIPRNPKIFKKNNDNKIWINSSSFQRFG